MKKHFIKFTLLLLSIICISCSKNDDTKVTPVTDPANIVAGEFINLKCNNVQYNFINPEILNSGAKTLNAFTTNEKRISIFLPLTVTAGTYSITDSSNPNAYALSLAINLINLDAYATAGSITVTSVTSNNVKGTFNCSFPSSGGQNFIVTEGSFNVGN